jgi:hypothetical protein
MRREFLLVIVTGGKRNCCEFLFWNQFLELILQKPIEIIKALFQSADDDISASVQTKVSALVSLNIETRNSTVVIQEVPLN